MKRLKVSPWLVLGALASILGLIAERKCADEERREHQEELNEIRRELGLPLKKEEES